ncbi:Signal peptidase complex subunit SPC3 [Beauveria bassiana D1-5]|uniref:Signal peptidase subunit 3 n=1 Tax=Beauveria bassiana D1-5 TaxID=1245745 RepID=A0A0A2VED5_BEABA|nr:Signal peptidase complex subunit SPC3 [Beauveria bassiana D1-5]
MYNSFNRIQNVFGFFTTVACVFGAFIAATDLFSPREPSGIITPDNIQVVKGRSHYYSTKKEEYAVIRFSLDADLSSLFTWNTKNLFVYVTADWPGADNTTNSAVIWDSIITNPSADHLLNIGPATLKKLRKSSAGKSIDPNRYVMNSLQTPRAQTKSTATIFQKPMSNFLSANITGPFSGKLKIKNQKPKYQITHPSGKIAQTEDVTLKLHYNVQPWVGLLTWNLPRDLFLWKTMSGGESDKLALPALKVKEAKETKAKPKAKVNKAKA